LDKTSKPAHHRPKAYQDTRFLESKDARALRILAEYMEPLYRLQRHKVDDTAGCWPAWSSPLCAIRPV
jgi:hypothetical protein